ncbi:hypothetical protein [Thiorhodovibrio frisius]|uniref:DUF2281 domain-containing protein n=1 Tax=Thiorhodovibrio frisius TaxID=631362 RepID=H8Z8Q9_9GAMM|nr:hypothetical protein [Thiorhodovibrio frisius]EIC19464.1 hypothetical protein Thi970DRAFT_04988 [Thiorhodovibrio frisius]WPL22230.1 hypothetical protein Thiofri_02390 [Thiorhodovibrio frisius]
MSTINQLQFDIERGIKDLPIQALKEIKLFIDFLHVREGSTQTPYSSDMNYELRQLDIGEARHLEQEFIAYQDRYPREN